MRHTLRDPKTGRFVTKERFEAIKQELKRNGENEMSINTEKAKYATAGKKINSSRTLIADLVEAAKKKDTAFALDIESQKEIERLYSTDGGKLISEMRSNPDLYHQFLAEIELAADPAAAAKNPVMAAKTVLQSGITEGMVEGADTAHKPALKEMRNAAQNMHEVIGSKVEAASEMRGKLGAHEELVQHFSSGGTESKIKDWARNAKNKAKQLERSAKRNPGLRAQAKEAASFATEAEALAGRFYRAGDNSKLLADIFEHVKIEKEGLGEEMKEFLQNDVNDLVREAADRFNDAREMVGDIRDAADKEIYKNRVPRAAHPESLVNKVKTGTKFSAIGEGIEGLTNAASEIGGAVEGFLRRDASKGHFEKLVDGASNLKKGKAAMVGGATALGAAWLLGAFKSKHPEYGNGAARGA